jgi:hypothetical protein
MHSILFGVAFVAYGAFAPEFFINADATIYAEQIRGANFSERTTHLGYYLFAYPVVFLPFKIDHALNLLNCALGAGVVVLIALIGEVVAKSRLAGYVAGGIAFANQGLAYNALHAEAYAGQTFFLLLGIYLWLRRRNAEAGVCVAVSFLFSASTAFAAPFFLVTRPRVKPLLQLAAASGGGVALALLPVWRNYLFGARGLMGAADNPVSFTLAFLKTGQDGFYGYYALIPFFLAGLYVTRRWRFTWAVAATGAVVFLFGEKFMDVPVQLPTWMLACVIAAVGVHAVKWPFAAAAFAILIPILAVYPFVPARIADHLPSVPVIAVYCGAVALVALFRARAFAIALSLNLAFIAHSALQIRQSLAEFAVKADSVVPTNWNEMVRRNWIVCGSAYCESQNDRNKKEVKPNAPP